MSICKYCHTDHPLDALRRCPSCADAGDATRAGLHYGDYMARRGQPIRPVPVEAPRSPSAGQTPSRPAASAAL